MQGLADGYFILPDTINDSWRTSSTSRRSPPTTPPSSRWRRRSRNASTGLLAVKGTRTVDWFHRELGKVIGITAGWNAADPGLKRPLARSPRSEPSSSRTQCPGPERDPRRESLEKAGRVIRLLGWLSLMSTMPWAEEVLGHFKVSTSPPTARPLRNDVNALTSRHGSSPATARSPRRTEEEMEFEYVQLAHAELQVKMTADGHG